ncbi:MAG: M6 family metalloprotease domain-containing protein [Elusimicrobia bacterium]|nr:M6 family metalloprotease domain-containing protein [Elusimicrobiota bacterium]
MKKFLLILIITTAYFLSASWRTVPCLFSVPHINGKDPGPKEYVRKIPDIRVLKTKGMSQNAIAKTVGAIGTKNIAVILVNFSGAGTDTSGSHTMSSDEVYGLNAIFDYFKNFYKEASYGQLNLNITFFYSTGSATTLSGGETPYTLADTMSSYGEDTDSSLSQLIIDSLNACGGGVTSAGYDGVMVAHAGFGNESTTNDGDIWAAYVGPFALTHGFIDGTNIPVKESGASPIGVACHEFGHQLGLWDLYSTGVSGGTSQVGKWSLMDYGVWVKNGANPAHPCAWDKYKLGWLTPVEISSGTHSLTTHAFETSANSVYKLKPVNSDTEYFLVYHTSRTAYSPYTPGDGLLILHIDEGTIDGVTLAQRMANNSLNNYSHRTVDVEEADTSDPYLNFGDSTDLWPGTRITFTAPYADKYDGQMSMLAVFDITNQTQYSNFTVSYKPFISGYVKNAAGTGSEDVVVQLYTASGSYSEYITSTDGYYVFTNLENGIYTVKAIKSGWRFTPESISVTISNLHSTGNDFAGIAEVSYVDLIGEPDNIKPVNNLFIPGQEKTTIYYKTSEAGDVTIKLYTLDGRFIKTLLDEYVSAGIGSVTWDGKNLDDNTVSSGIYLVHIIAPSGYKAIKKICVIR